MDNTDTIYWVGWSACRSIGAQTIHRLRKHFPSLRAAWEAPSTELARAGIAGQRVVRISHERNTISLERLEHELSRHQINTVRVDQPAYPPLLKEIYDPPALLYYRGTLPEKHALAIAVVGTRKTSSYGRLVTPRIVTPLASAGLTIVSGLALGIDTIAHRTTLAAGGQTVAVLAGGLERTYPVSNTRLAQDIIDHGGMIISEYPPGTPPLKQHFPVRNRIIAGLSRLVVVIEGTADSGSLITARCALDQNRDVCAVPGPITSDTAHGPHHLLKLGAQLVTSADDIFQALQLDNIPETVQNRKILPDSPAEEAILSLVTQTPVEVDEIFQKSRLPNSIVNTTLTTLEMKGLIRRSGGTQYVRT